MARENGSVYTERGAKSRASITDGGAAQSCACSCARARLATIRHRYLRGDARGSRFEARVF